MPRVGIASTQRSRLRFELRGVATLTRAADIEGNVGATRVNPRRIKRVRVPANPRRNYARQYFHDRRGWRTKPGLPKVEQAG